MTAPTRGVRPLTKFDKGGRRPTEELRNTICFRFLFFACLAKAVVPGAVNFAQQPHPLPGMEFGYTFTPLAGTVSSILSGLLLLVCLAVISSPGRMSVPSTIVLFLGLVVMTQARMTPDWLNSHSITTIALVALVVLAVCATQPTRRDLKVVGVGTALVALAAGALGLLAPRNAEFLIGGNGVDGTKALIGAYVLAGPMTHSNTLGISVALGLPFLGLVSSRKRRLMMQFACIVVVVLSASRTALLAIVAWAAFRVLARLFREFQSRLVRGGLLVTACAMVVALPLTLDDRLALSTRVGLWQDALSAWRSSDDLLLGLGPYWTSADLAAGIVRSSSAHNLFVQWLVSGGLLLLLAGLAVLIAAAKRAVGGDRGEENPVLTGYLCVLLVISSTEYVLPPTVSSQLFPMTGFVLASLLAMRPTDPPVKVALPR